MPIYFFPFYIHLFAYTPISFFVCSYLSIDWSITHNWIITKTKDISISLFLDDHYPIIMDIINYRSLPTTIDTFLPKIRLYRRYILFTLVLVFRVYLFIVIIVHTDTDTEHIYIYIYIYIYIMTVTSWQIIAVFTHKNYNSTWLITNSTILKTFKW